jgi:SAM-dependent methyltransferase
MHERLALVKIAPERILDAGCGAGQDLVQLQKSYPAAQIVGIDASVAMLQAARAPAPPPRPLNQLLSRLMPAKTGVDLLSGDFGNLPLGPNSIDLVWSNLALHWHPQPDKVFAEWRRVLRVDGLLMFSNFGPDTFKELRSAFAAMDESPHALPFVDMHDFGDQLVDAGFSTPVMDMESIARPRRQPPGHAASRAGGPQCVAKDAVRARGTAPAGRQTGADLRGDLRPCFPAGAAHHGGGGGHRALPAAQQRIVSPAH